jgi:hypothetical protein
MLVALCIGGITLALIATAGHWWKKQGNIKVYVNGKASVGPSMYRSRNGHLLVKMEDGLYIIFPDLNEVGTASPSNFIIFPGYAYSRSVTPPFSLMSPVKSVGPQLIINADFIEFNPSDDVRVSISWGSNK